MNNKPSVITDIVVVVLVVLVTLALLTVSIPLLRDFVLVRIDPESRNWLTSSRVYLVSWVDWFRIVLEVALALFITNQIFNDQLRSFFQIALERLRNQLTLSLEKSVKQDDARIKVRNAIHEIIAFLYLPKNLRDLPDDIQILFQASVTINNQVRRGIPYLFIRLLALRALGAFSGKLHGAAALIAFWGVLLMKVLKLYLDSPILNQASKSL